MECWHLAEHCNPNKKVQEAIHRHERKELYEDQYEQPMHHSRISKNKAFKSTSRVENLCRLNSMEPANSKNIKALSKFDDMSSWITDNSEVDTSVKCYLDMPIPHETQL